MSLDTTHHKMHAATQRLMGREQWVQRSPEWFAVRRGLLTASDAASALDIKPYPSYRGSSRAELLRRKVTDESLANMFMAHGQKYEDAARDWAAAAMGETVMDVGLVRHETLHWLAASPDGVTCSGKLLEIKCPMKREIQPGHIPSHYYPQVQCQMEVCDVDSTIFVQYKPACVARDGRAFLDIVVVERDREWFRRNRDDLESFWREFTRERAKPGVRDAPGVTAAAAAAAAKSCCQIRDDMYCVAEAAAAEEGDAGGLHPDTV